MAESREESTQCLICQSGDLVDIVLNNLEMKKCKKCGLVWLKKADISKEYYKTKKISSDLIAKKIKIKTSNAFDSIRQFRKKVSLNNLCDIGCGDGSFLKALKRKGYKNVIGIEPSIDNINFSKNSGLEVFQGEAKDFEEITKNKNIRTVTMFTVIEHLENPLESLKTIYKGLAKGGALVVVTPDMDCYSFKKTNYQHKSIHSEHFFYFNKSNLKTLLRKAGFKIRASGKREFYQNNLGVKELLFRLGLKKKLKSSASEETEIPRVGNTPSNRDNFLFRIVKGIVRFILLRIVIFLGRLEFIWVIAEK